MCFCNIEFLSSVRTRCLFVVLYLFYFEVQLASHEIERFFKIYFSRKFVF